MVLSLVLLAVGLHKGFRENTTGQFLPQAILVVCLIIPAGIMVVYGAGIPALVTLLYFLGCGILLEVCLRHPGVQQAGLLAGCILFALAFMAYPLREMFFIRIPFLNIIGTMVSAGFALIVTGWLSAIRNRA
jgi:hypothetical protein